MPGVVVPVDAVIVLPDVTDIYHDFWGVTDEITKEFAIELSMDKFKPLGITHCRATISEDGKTLWVEGWRVWPGLDGEPAPPSRAGWVIGDGDSKRFRSMDQAGIDWTDDPRKAIRFARRDDAEMFAAGDEDAWHILEYNTLKLPQ